MSTNQCFNYQSIKIQCHSLNLYKVAYNHQFYDARYTIFLYIFRRAHSILFYFIILIPSQRFITDSFDHVSCLPLTASLPTGSPPGLSRASAWSTLSLAPTPPETCTGGVACSGRFTSPDYIIEPCPVPTGSRLTRLSAASIAAHQFDTGSYLFHDSSYTMSIFGEVRYTCC